MGSSDPPPAPVFVMPPPDPGLAVLEQQTQEQNIKAQQTQSTLDTAHLMQRYGVISALSGSTSPLSAGAQTVASSISPSLGAAGMQGGISNLLNALIGKAA